MSYATLTENALHKHETLIQDDSDECVYDANLELAESVISGAMDLPDKVSVASSIDAHGPASVASTRYKKYKLKLKQHRFTDLIF